MNSFKSSLHKAGLFAFVLTATTAFAFTKPVAEQNVYNSGSKQNPNWQPLTTTNYQCEALDNVCTAHRDSQGNISDEQSGQFVP